MARTVSIPPIESFGRLTQDKWLALKTLEESAEMTEALKTWLRSPEGTDLKALARVRFEDEVADVLQTMANLCTAFDISDLDLKNALQRCCARHYMRGRMDEHA